jgi:hypothetical protein
MNGWLTAKKRGRDDEQIEKDRSGALEARQNQRQKGKPKAAQIKGSRAKTTSKKKKSNVFSDSDGSMEDFIVDEEEEEEEEEELSEAKYNEGGSDDEDSLDSGEDLDTFPGLHKKRGSRPPPKNPVGKNQPKVKSLASRKKPPPPAINLDLSDTGSEDEFSRPSKAMASRKNPAPIDLCSFDSGSEVDFPRPSKALASRKKDAAPVDLCSSDNCSKAGLTRPTRIRKLGQAKKAASVLAPSGSSDEDSLLHDPFATKKKKNDFGDATTSRFFAKRNEDDDDTPLLPTAIRKSNVKNYSIQDDEDDGSGCLVDSPVPQKCTKNLATARRKVSGKSKPSSNVPGGQPSKQRKSSKTGESAYKKFSNQDLVHDEPSDEDEALALALAISKSENEATKVSLSDPGSQEENSMVDLLEESSEDEAEEEQDDYVDPAAREASSVLAKANALSAQILKTLTQWSASVDSTIAPSMGMITDGAVNLSTMGTGHSTKDHTWISKEVMSKICPNVTLADYQLVGVNWMALLHGMKCEVEGSKSYTNVNGILADGTCEKTVRCTFEWISCSCNLTPLPLCRSPEMGLGS